jgi:hypothetical protein
MNAVLSIERKKAAKNAINAYGLNPLPVIPAKSREAGASREPECIDFLCMFWIPDLVHTCKLVRNDGCEV